MIPFTIPKLEFTDEEFKFIRLNEKGTREIFNRKRADGFTTLEILSSLIQRFFEDDWRVLNQDFDDNELWTSFDFT